MSNFWNNKIFHENASKRGVEIEKNQGKLDFGLTWSVQLNRPRHRLLLLNRKKTCASFALSSETRPLQLYLQRFFPRFLHKTLIWSYKKELVIDFIPSRGLKPKIFASKVRPNFFSCSSKNREFLMEPPILGVIKAQFLHGTSSLSFPRGKGISF